MRKSILFTRNLLGTVTLLLILFPSFLHAQLHKERGLVLFLLIDRFDPAWKSKFFGNTLPAATTHLRQVLDNSLHQ